MNYSFELTKSSEVRGVVEDTIPFIREEVDWLSENAVQNFDSHLRALINNPKNTILTCRRDGKPIPFYLVCSFGVRAVHILAVVNGPVNGSKYYMYGSIREAVHNFFRDEGFRTFSIGYIKGSQSDHYYDLMLRQVTSYSNWITDGGGQSKIYRADLTSYTPT